MYNLKLSLYITKNTGLSINKSNKILNIILKEIINKKASFEVP